MVNNGNKLMIVLFLITNTLCGMLTTARMAHYALRLKQEVPQIRAISCCAASDPQHACEKRIQNSTLIAKELIAGYGLSGSSAEEHAQKFEQQLKTAGNDCRNLVLPEILETAAGLNLSACVSVILAYAKEQGRTLSGAEALHMAQTKEVVQWLIDSNELDITGKIFGRKINSPFYNLTVLHTAPNDVIPSLLQHGADIGHEVFDFKTHRLMGTPMTNQDFSDGYLYDIATVQSKLLFSALSVRSNDFCAALKKLHKEYLVRCDGFTWNDSRWNSKESLVSALEREISDSRFKTTAAFKEFESYGDKRLASALHEHCDVVYNNNSEYYWQREFLRLGISPIAHAIMIRDVARLKIFLKHAAPEVIKAQAQKLLFLAKIMPALFPGHDRTYLKMAEIVRVYARWGFF